MKRSWIPILFAIITCSGLASAEQRIITAGGTITEIVFALGQGQTVIATDSSSNFPQSVNQLPKVGYYRELAAEGVLSMAPTHLFTIEGAGREQALKQIASTGVDVKIYKSPKSMVELADLISTLGSDLNASSKAKQLIKDIQSSLPNVKEGAKFDGSKNKSALYLLSAGSRGLVAAGEETVPDFIFNYAGVKNIASQHLGFKPFNKEYLALEQPDFIVMPAHSVTLKQGRPTVCDEPSLTYLHAIKNCNVLVMDGLLSLGMTTRVADAIKQVAEYKAEL